MIDEMTEIGTGGGCSNLVGLIPVRNLWLLMLYASELLRYQEFGRYGVEDNPDDIPDLVAEILCHAVERRLKRNLSYSYCPFASVLDRVRGRVDLVATHRRNLLTRGLVACRFEDLTSDTCRNRLVRAALEAMARALASRRQDLAHRCRAMANSLKALGVAGSKPSRTEIGTDRISRNDTDDRFMVAAAMLACDLALPTEESGTRYLAHADRDAVWVRHLFEKAIGGFYDVVLSPHGWSVQPGKALRWPIDRETPGISSILPSMRTDMVLNSYVEHRRIIVDTKFNAILISGWHREETIRSAYVYQIYAYIRSQEDDDDPLSRCASGLLLHPSVGETVDETVVIQGHAIRFATVDLTAEPREIRRQLLGMIDFPFLPTRTWVV